MRFVLAILCAASLAATGCGDDDEDTAAVETTPVTQIETATVPAEDGATTPEPDPEPEDGRARDEGDLDDSAGDGAAGPGDDAGAGNGAIGAPGECGRIAFERNTDSGAFGIEAVGVGCRVARAVARGARDRRGDLSYEARGFSCSGARRDDPGLPSVEWVCLRGEDQLVRFRTT